eukprot:6195190-Pleurochrysis_carterae.AAC.2
MELPTHTCISAGARSTSHVSRANKCGVFTNGSLLRQDVFGCPRRPRSGSPVRACRSLRKALSCTALSSAVLTRIARSTDCVHSKEPAGSERIRNGPLIAVPKKFYSQLNCI